MTCFLNFGGARGTGAGRRAAPEPTQTQKGWGEKKKDGQARVVSSCSFFWKQKDFCVCKPKNKQKRRGCAWQRRRESCVCPCRRPVRGAERECVYFFSRRPGSVCFSSPLFSSRRAAPGAPSARRSKNDPPAGFEPATFGLQDQRTTTVLRRKWRGEEREGRREEREREWRG